MKYIWENPEIIKENKEDGHVLALCYADAASRFQESPRRISFRSVANGNFFGRKASPRLTAE